MSTKVSETWTRPTRPESHSESNRCPGWVWPRSPVRARALAAAAPQIQLALGTSGLHSIPRTRPDSPATTVS